MEIGALYVPYLCWKYTGTTNCVLCKRGLLYYVCPCLGESTIRGSTPGVGANCGWIKEKSMLTFVM